MTPAERTKYLGHWSTESLALKDMHRLLLHAWRGCKDRDNGCTVCDQIARRLWDSGFTKPISQGERKP